MEDGVAAGDRRRNPLGVAQVGLHDLDLVADPEQLQARAPRSADVGQARLGAVEDAHGSGVAEQRPGQMRGDEAVGAGYERPLQLASTTVSFQVRQGASPLAQRSPSTTASL